MKAQPMRIGDDGYEPCEPQEATHVMLNVLGPIPTRIIPVQIKGTRKGTGNWTWNGDTEKPTLKPSILSRVSEELVCHSFVNDGEICFLADCTHELAGQTWPLLEVDWFDKGE